MNNKMLRNLIISGVALVVIVAVILVLVFVPFGTGDDSGTAELDSGIDMTLGVNSDGLHTATINTNENGEIENNSYGTLIEYEPSKIKKITVKSDEGSYTFNAFTPVNSDGTLAATEYTLEGFEDYTLASTKPSLIASASCYVAFTKVADLSGEKASEFGFDEPRAEATVEYIDGTHSVVRLGDNAAGGTQCYIQFGDNDTVYVAAVADMEPLLYSITDLFSATINPDATSVGDDTFDKITLGGTHLSEEVVIVENDDEALYCYYTMSSHGNRPVNNTEGSNIVGSVKTVTGEAVVCINPDDKQLEKYGLKTPFATVATTYNYTDTQYDDEGNEISSEEKTLKVALAASEADSDGYVYVMEQEGNLIYKVLADNVPWATTTMSALQSEYVHNPMYSGLDTVTINIAEETYKFAVAHEEVISTDEEGNETTNTVYTVTCNGTEIDEPMFYVMYQDLALMEIGGADDGTEVTSELMSVTYTYNTDRAADTVTFGATGTQKAVAELNGERSGYVYKSYVTALCENIEKLAKGEDIATVR